MSTGKDAFSQLWDGKQGQWSREDLDTLRHEAHHMVQDCRDNNLDGHLHTVYKDPLKLAKDWLGQNTMRIMEIYEDRGTKMVIIELEAFSVAAMNDPDEQVRDIGTYCF